MYGLLAKKKKNGRCREVTVSGGSTVYTDVVTEPSITSARPLGLGSKLYPSSMQRMLNKDVTRFKHILSGQRKNRANATKALLAGETIRECEQSNESHLLTFELQHTTKTTFF